MVIGFLPLILFWCGLPQLASINAFIFGRIVIIPIQILLYHGKASEYFAQMHPKLCHVLKTMWHSVKPPNAVDSSPHEPSNDKPSGPPTSGASLPQPGLTKEGKQPKTMERSDTHPRFQRIKDKERSLPCEAFPNQTNMDHSTHEPSNDEPSGPSASGASLPQPRMTGQGEHQKTLDRSVTHGNTKQEVRGFPQLDTSPKEINNMALNAQHRWWPKAATSKEMTCIQID